MGLAELYDSDGIYCYICTYFLDTNPICALNTKFQISPYKIIDSENFIKVYQNPNKVARDTQRLPTVPHNDFGGLNFKGLASKYLLLMTLPPADDDKMKKNRTSG